MNEQKELEYLREKVALLEKYLEYERLLRDMREAAPRGPVYVPCPYPAPQPAEPCQPWITRPDTSGSWPYYPYPETICIPGGDVPGANGRGDTMGNVYRLGIGGGTYV